MESLAYHFFIAGYVLALAAAASYVAIPLWPRVAYRSAATTAGTSITIASRSEPPAVLGPFATGASWLMFVALTFSLAPDEPGRLEVLDMKGRLVRHVWTGIGTGGSQMALWDGKTDDGWIAPAGVYVARLEGAAGRAAGQKIVRVP